MKPTANIILIAAAAWLAFGGFSLPSPGPSPSPGPAPTTPSAELQQAVAPLAGVVGSAVDAARVAALFAVAAESVERNAAELGTTADLQQRLQEAFGMLFQGTPSEGKYPGSGAKVAEVLKNPLVLGKLPASVSENKARIVKGLQAMAWGVTR